MLRLKNGSGRALSNILAANMIIHGISGSARQGKLYDKLHAWDEAKHAFAFSQYTVSKRQGCVWDMNKYVLHATKQRLILT